jgi:hypothetical protein
MRPPDGTPDVENLPIVVFPPLPSNLAFPQTRKCSDTDDRPDEVLADLGRIRPSSVEMTMGSAPEKSCL